MKRKRISVIIPSYQHAATLPACLDAILAQTYTSVEILVVNDGSTDGTEEVLAKYSGRITAIHQENQGAQAARNNGFAASTGEYVIFCDADVVMQPKMLQKMAHVLDEHSDIDICYSAFRFGWKGFKGIPFSDERLRKGNFIHTTSLIRRLAFPGFDPAIKRLQDWDVWLTMLARGSKGQLIDEQLFEVKVEGDSRIGSQWMPSIMYRIPWKWLPWQPKAISRYQHAREAIVNKHHLV